MNDEKAPNVNEAAGGASGLSAGLDRCQPPPRDGWFVKYGASLGGGIHKAPVARSVCF